MRHSVRRLFATLRSWFSRLTDSTLRQKIVLGVLPVIVISILLLGTFSYILVRRQIILGVQKEVNTLAENASISLQSFFQQRLNDLESVSETPLIRDYFKNVEYGLREEAEVYRREIENYFVKFSARAQVYDSISLVSRDGRTICATSHPHEANWPGNPDLEDFMAVLRRGSVYKAPLAGYGGGSMVRRYAKPMFDESGRFRGGVVLDCDLTYVEDILSRLQVGEKGTAYLEDHEGGLILGKRPAFSQPLIGSSQIAGSTLRVVVATRAEDFLSLLTQIQHLTIFFLAFACFSVMLFIVWRVSIAVAPIQEMVRGTRRFALGDLAFRIDEPEIGELKVLASSFNHMAGSLQERTRQLERRIQQLTALRDIENLVTQRLEESTILRNSLEAVARGFSFDRVALFWVDHKQKEIAGRHIYNVGPRELSEETFQKRRATLDGGDILCDVVRSRAAVLVKQLGDGPPGISMMEGLKTRAFVAAPICGKDRVFGVITADNHISGRTLEESDKEGLALFANALGLALENVTLFQNLAQSEARYRTVLDNSPEAVIGLSREFWITTWNRGAESIFGHAAEDMIGKPMTVLFPPDMEKEFRPLLSRVMENGSVRDHSLSGVRKNGTPLDLSVSWGGAHREFLLNQEWTVVIRDVTEAKKLQQQLIRTEKLSVVGQLISSIAHELNNPLTAVVGYAELLAEDELVESQAFDKEMVRKDLQIITENAARCRKIIENLLLFVRQGEVEKKPVALQDVLQATLQLLDYKLRKKGTIKVDQFIPADLPPMRGNFQQLQQVLVNLINNACDAMSTWPGPKRIEIHARNLGDVIHMEIMDSGPGIPPEIQAHIFEPFFTTKGAGHGTGLGLAVSREIVEEHQGRIGVNSRPGMGASFWLEVPIATYMDATAKISGPIIPAVKGKSILVVDDEPDVLNFLAKLFDRENDRYQTAASLKEAIDKASKEDFDLVVTDIQLGEGTGIDLYDHWTDWSSHARPDFIFLTGDVINVSLAKVLEKKGLAVVHKPIELKSFQQIIRGILTR